MLFVVDCRDAETIAAFADDREAHGGDACHIKEVCIDMSGPFIEGVDDNLTKAEIAFDKFHAVKLVNDVIDKIRRAESKDRAELNRCRYLWLSDVDTWGLSTFNGALAGMLIALDSGLDTTIVVIGEPWKGV